MLNDVAALAARLQSHVEVLADVIGSRHLGRRSAFDAAAAYCERGLGRTGDRVLREPYQVDGAEVCNLLMERPGDDPRAGTVILGAHYDTVTCTPGADDNASAVAVLLEVAALLREVRCRRSIRFVAFACEEPPHFYTDTMGSQVHARACRQRGERVVAMVCLEMVGYFSDEPGSQRIPPTIPKLLRGLFPARGDFLASVGNLRSMRAAWAFHRGFRGASALPLFSIALPERVREIRLSDNSSFWDQGYPALMVTDTSFLRNPHYHEPTDRPGTLDFERMALGALGVAGGVARLAGGRWPR